MSKVTNIFDFKRQTSDAPNVSVYRSVLLEIQRAVEEKASKGCMVSKLYCALVDYLSSEKDVEVFRTTANFKVLELVDGVIHRFEVASLLPDYVGSFVTVERVPAADRCIGVRYSSNASTLHFSHSVLQMLNSDVALAGPTSFITQPFTKLITSDARNLLKSSDAVGLEALLREDEQYDVKVSYGGWFETRNIGQ